MDIAPNRIVNYQLRNKAEVSTSSSSISVAQLSHDATPTSNHHGDTANCNDNPAGKLRTLFT
jgi:hypothetical protein